MSQDYPQAFADAPAYPMQQAQQICDHWNKQHAIGLCVLCWPRGFESPARLARTRSFARKVPVNGQRDGETDWQPSVWIEGDGEPVPLSRVAELHAGNMRGRVRLEFEAVVEVDLAEGVLDMADRLGIAVERQLRPLKLAIAGSGEPEPMEATTAGDVADGVEP